jgi:pimeloyl-ACP methyl ester carboxylesterase
MPLVPASSQLLVPYNTATVVAETHLVAQSPQTSSQPQTTNRAFPAIEGNKRRHLDHIYAYDAQPLGNRTPVIIVPGRVQERQANPWWKKLGEEAKETPAFDQHYKLYLFLYDSEEELEDMSREFAQELKILQDWLTGGRSVAIISYSLGGLIARDALEDYPGLLDKTDLVFGLSTPYHGSPMFDPQWFTDYLHHVSPIRTLWDRATYTAYMFNKSNLTRGLNWVNFDRSMPQYVQPKTDDERQAFSQTQQTQPIFSESPENKAFKDRLIPYGSYLDNPFTDPNWKSDLFSDVVNAPKRVVGTVLPFYGFSVHAVFNYMNQQMANLPTYSEDNPKGKNEHLYRYNDGIIPLSSMLHLPAREQPYRESLLELAALADTCNVRVFREIDHVDMGHYRWPTGRLSVLDEIHPKEGVKRTPTEWLFYDLMHWQQVKRASATVAKARQAYCK